MFLFSPATGDLALLPQLIKYVGECLGNYIHQFPQNPELHVVSSHRFVYVQAPQVVLNLIFSCKELVFLPQVLVLRFRALEM